MSSKLTTVLGLIAHYKYLITIVVGVLIVGVFDENSFLQRVKYDMRISELKDEIKKYNDLDEQANAKLNSLKRNPKAIERIARERYFMKSDDEDIYVLSTDKPADDGLNKINNLNETTK